MNFLTLCSWILSTILKRFLDAIFSLNIPTVFPRLIFALLFRNVIAFQIFDLMTILVWNIITFCTGFCFRSIFCHCFAIRSIIELTGCWIVDPNFSSFTRLFPMLFTTLFFFGCTFIFLVWYLNWCLLILTFSSSFGSAFISHGFFTVCFNPISAFLTVLCIANSFVP